MIYRLFRDDGCCVSEFRRDESLDCALCGELFDVFGWGENNEDLDYEFVSNIYIKWDACSHFNMYGERYKKCGDLEKDSYYHICGSVGYFNFMRSIAFAYTLAKDLIEGSDKEEFNDILKLGLLEGYTIVKLEDTNN